ncbi:hypothetical protein [Streptococcus merionis]|uniref:hypothetical protein n=1 Tax=Streptococcus merionis TaxID=400065 RepID=UPI0026ED87D1|nr:hypothetical protein [Streptococcus merionis]
MLTTQILLFLGAFTMLIGFLVFSLELYQLIKIDAQARQMNRPEIWALSAAGRGNVIGLYHYLVERRQHPITHQTEDNHLLLQKHKKVAIAFLVVGFVGAILMLIGTLFLAG